MKYVLLATLLAFSARVMATKADQPLPDTNAYWESAQKGLRTKRFSVPTRLGPLAIELHLPEESLSLLPFLEKEIQESAPKIVDYFDWRPNGAVHLHLNTAENQANGYASVFPTNHIGLHLMPPVGEESLISNTQYMRALIIHELIHIVHMDQTRGILKTLRTIFGSVGKLGGVVPRWFSEGIATWGESHFTSGGRLRWPAIDRQLELAFQDPEFCQTLDCLDQPGAYPYGHLSYWAGARFMAYLEQQRTGAIACLVKENSRRLPFFLNVSFRACLGAEAETLFAQFREQQGYDQTQKRERVILSEPGMSLTKDWLVQPEERGRRVVLVTSSHDGQTSEVWSWGERIVGVMPGTGSERLSNQVLVRTTTHPFQSKTRWWHLDLESKTKREVTPPKESDYLFSLSEDTYWLWHFFEGRWELASWKVGEENVTPLLRLDPRETMRFPRLIEWQGRPQLFFASQWVNPEGVEVFALKAYQSGERPKMILAAREPFQFLDAADEVILFKQHNGELVSLGKNARRFEAPARLSTVRLLGGGRSEVYANGWLETRPGEMGSQGVLKLERELVRVSELSSPSEEESTELSHYPDFRHFAPRYWVFGIGGSENLTRYDVATSLSDPIGRHTFSALASHYQEISETGFELGYTYWPGAFGLNLTGGKSYTLRGTRQSADRLSSFELSVMGRKRWGRWGYFPSLFGTYDDVDDFISSREQRSVGLSQTLTHTPLFRDSFVGESSVSAAVYRQFTKGFKAFWGERYSADLNLRSGWEPLELNLKGSFGRLNKEGFINGVLYGGGSEGLYQLGGVHEFYGVQYGDIFGNQITTARAQLALRLGEVYRGYGFFPLFLKTSHLLIGSDYVKARAIFLDNQFIPRGRLESYHVGLRFLTDLAYYIPMSIDLIYAQVKNPIGADQSQVLFLLRGDFDFGAF